MNRAIIKYWNIYIPKVAFPRLPNFLIHTLLSILFTNFRINNIITIDPDIPIIVLTRYINKYDVVHSLYDEYIYYIHLIAKR